MGQYNAKLTAMEVEIQNQIATRTTTKPTGNARGPRELYWANDAIGGMA
jgi:hypothetical protein